MITLDPKEKDDAEFVELVSRILTATTDCYKPVEIYVIHVDNWFDHKWKGFSGVVMPQLGTWAGPLLRVPPFHPNRVVSQLHLRLDDPTEPIYAFKRVRPLHVLQTSVLNMERRLRDLAKPALFIWYSGNTKTNDRASLMVYTTSEEIDVSWYVSFVKQGNWGANKVKGISKRGFAELTEMYKSTTDS